MGLFNRFIHTNVTKNTRALQQVKAPKAKAMGKFWIQQGGSRSYKNKGLK